MFWSLREKRLQRGKGDQWLMITEGEMKDSALGLASGSRKSQATLRRAGKVPALFELHAGEGCRRLESLTDKYVWSGKNKW